MLYYKTFHHSHTADWVVFVHGAGGSSSIWYKQIKVFAAFFNVLILDLRGHGKSQHMSKPYEHYNFKEISEEILEVLDHAGVEKAHFIGISLGTLIIRTLYDIAPQRFNSMILAGAIMRLNLRARVLSKFGDLFKTVVPYMWLYKFFAWIIMPKKRHKKSRLLFISQAKKLCQKEFIHWYRLLYEVNGLLRYFKENDTLCPTLYIMGSEDYMFLPFVKTVAASHQNATLEIVADSGHVVNIDQPEEFNNRVIRFLLGR
jgi:pimeloyl-ACP methyl ester carboxylesterase